MVGDFWLGFVLLLNSERDVKTGSKHIVEITETLLLGRRDYGSIIYIRSCIAVNAESAEVERVDYDIIRDMKQIATAS